jgi:methylase of polypeptide subunit release factors
VELSKRYGLVVGTDLVRPSMRDWREAGANYVLADGASCLRDSFFDLVVFNPPYIASVVGDDPAVEGGRKLEVPMYFLSEALRVVRSGGRVVFLLNEQADAEEFCNLCAEKGFGLVRVASERGFFEELTVYSAESTR